MYYSTVLYPGVIHAKSTDSNLLYSTLCYTTRTSHVEEAVEVVEEPKNSKLLIEHILCQVYRNVNISRMKTHLPFK